MDKFILPPSTQTEFSAEPVGETPLPPTGQTPVKTEQLYSPEDIAAAYFTRAFPRMKQLVMDMSKKELQRVIICAAAYPLTPAGFSIRSEREGMLAHDLEHMVMSKSVMIAAMIEFKKQQESAAENTKEISEETENEKVLV